jgi:Zn finger protein HypA/HybF involved in hydrogenase expression
MERDFICPKCFGQLYLNERIIFSVQKHDGTRGLILLTAEPGDYRVLKHPAFKITEGEHLDFFCPLCHSNLTIEKDDKKFTLVTMIETGDEYEVLFSQIAGEKSTYVVGEHFFKAFGDDADENTNFWGESPNY